MKTTEILGLALGAVAILAIGVTFTLEVLNKGIVW